MKYNQISQKRHKNDVTDIALVFFVHFKLFCSFHPISGVPIIDFDHVNIFWEAKYLFGNVFNETSK